ncbi:hypothetical protein [Acidovorax cavernicola]|uniref:Uncharacterized protein n=1 Tax=Acidovorax cavernicola TaxID=1675792 RepID=A0A9X8D600_9BURK|nr:hypothetical protein [Acidovorax cavernicola]RIX81254.1 hypothetical protein D3H34_11015 [Acidovorax cavernicola]
MFSFFRKKPVRLHLGEVRAMPRKDFLRHLEGGYFGGGKQDGARLSARIYHLKSGKQRAVIRAAECMSWNEFFSVSGRWRVQLDLGNPADRQRLRELVQAAGRTLKAKVENAVS